LAGGGRWRTAAWTLATLAIAAGTLSLALGSPRRLVAELARVSLARLLAAAGLLGLAEAVKGVRLCLLAGTRRLRACVVARLLGKAAAAITPGGVAGVPTRGAVLASEARAELGRAMGAAVAETLADNIVALGVIIGGAVVGFVSIPVVGVAAFVAALWVGGSAAATSGRVASGLYERFHVPERLRCGLERERSLALRALASLLTRRLAPPALLVTVAAHLLEYTSVQVLWGGWWSPEAWLRSALAVEASYILVSIPTPGGSGAVEYGLTAYLGPRLALYWRTAYLLAALTPLLLAYTAYPGLRSYLEEYRGVLECPEPGGGDKAPEAGPRRPGG
jgi:hypothetical protein